MKHILRITLLIFIVKQLFFKVNCSNDSQGMNYALIKDYLQANNIKVCALLSCNSQDYFKLLNIFNGKSEKWCSFHDISNDYIEVEKRLIRLSHQVGVVIDLECSEIVEFLREMSKGTFFHRERYWLMFSSDMNRTFDVLQKQNINLDAEISIAIPVKDTARR